MTLYMTATHDSLALSPALPHYGLITLRALDSCFRRGCWFILRKLILRMGLIGNLTEVFGVNRTVGDISKLLKRYLVFSIHMILLF